MRLVAARIAERILHVTDQRIEPVRDVERAIRSELQRHRPEVGILGLQQRLHFDADEAGPFLDHAILLDALKSDHVVEQEVPLRLVWELPAAYELDAARRPHLRERPLLQRLVLARVVHVTRERGAIVIVAIRCVGDEVLTPAVHDMSPRIREGVGDEDAQLLRARLVAEHAGVFHADGTVGRLDLRMVKRALLEVEVATRSPREGMDRVMTVLRAEPVEDNPSFVRAAVAVGVAQEHQVRLLGDVDAAVTQLETHRHVEAVGEDR
jgi:hypothetical protein